MDRIASCSGFYNVRVSCVRFFGLGSGFMCSGCTGFIHDTITLSNNVYKVDFVEKLWRSLRKSLWVNCGKVLRRGVDKLVLHNLRKRFARFTKVCGKFCRRFTHEFYRGKSGVLHIFHIAYYYNY